MHQLTADSCQDGPCPLMAIDTERGMTAIQGYPIPEQHQRDLAPQPDGELRLEMRSEVLERMLADHLTDDALSRIQALRNR